MNVGSLFSGIGGMDKGLHDAGHRHVFFCEADGWRRQVLAARWPGVPIYDDVARVAVERTDQEPLSAGKQQLERIDLLAGGFPCQDLSVAGKRAGLAGERSGLFFEFARVIDALRPRWLLLENVPGLLSSQGGRDFGVVLATLADLGYGVAWRVLDSRFFGVPQRRRRVFIVATRADGDPSGAAGRAGEVLAVGSRCPGHPATGGEAGPDVAKSFAGRSPSRLDDAAVGGGQLVANTMMAKRGKGGIGLEETFVAAPLTKGSASGEGVNQPGRRQEDDANIVPFGWNWQTGGDFHPMVGEQAPTLQKNQTIAVGCRRLTPVECSRLQGLPDTWLDLESEYGRPQAPETHATQILRRLWHEVGTEAGEGWGSRVAVALLTPEVLLAGVYGGWISWEVAARRAAEGRSVQGEDTWPEGFVRGLRENRSAGSSPYRRESFEQLARELGRSLPELSLEETQIVACLLRSRMWAKASAEWPLRHARSAPQARGGSRKAASAALPKNLSSDSRRYSALGDAVTVPVAEWIGRRMESL